MAAPHACTGAGHQPGQRRGAHTRVPRRDGGREGSIRRRAGWTRWCHTHSLPRGTNPDRDVEQHGLEPQKGGEIRGRRGTTKKGGGGQTTANNNRTKFNHKIHPSPHESPRQYPRPFGSTPQMRYMTGEYPQRVVAMEEH